MARKPNPEAGRFELRAEPEELKSWAVAARAEDRTLGSWLRRVANKAAQKIKGGSGR